MERMRKQDCEDCQSNEGKTVQRKKKKGPRPGLAFLID